MKGDESEDLVIRVRVIPRASRDEIVGVLDGALKVRIQAPPVEGKANTCLVKFLAKQWGLRRADLEILSGASARTKRLLIRKPPPELRKELLSSAEK